MRILIFTFIMMQLLTWKAVIVTAMIGINAVKGQFSTVRPVNSILMNV